MLKQIRGPADLQHLSQSQLEELAAEIREFLIHKVAATGGHLGPNLGVVELTLALHRVFDSPHDPIIFDTGHQSYVHKILTGRAADFDQLRKKDGLSGYPARAESDHDWVESSHASTALSYADGLAKAFELSGHRNRHVVAVVGDGALTGGMCWEALNNIAGSNRPVVIVVNDNGRSYAPTIGGLADHLAALRLQPGYEKLLEKGRDVVRGVPVIGEICYQCMHSVKAGLKDALQPQAMFTDLGLKYVGPIDGHDEHAVEAALRHARGFNAPVIVHVVTRKGMGYAPAEADEAEQMHACGVIDPLTGLATSESAPGWTGTFSDELIKIATTPARRRRDHRGDAGPDRSGGVRPAVPGPALRCRHRRAARDDVGGRAGDGWHAPGGRHLLDVPQPCVRPDDDGRRAAPVAGDDRARPRRCHRSRRRQPQRHVGPVDAGHRARHAGRRTARRRPAARGTGRGAGGQATARRPSRFPKGAVGEDIPAIERRDGVDILAMPGPTASERRPADRGRFVRADGAGRSRERLRSTASV